jgi:hypothetical protein
LLNVQTSWRQTLINRSGIAAAALLEPGIIAPTLEMLIEFVFTLLIRIPAFLVDLVVKPGKESRSNKWLLRKP